MKRIFTIILLSIAISTLGSTFAENLVVTDNVVIVDELKEYEIQENRGEISGVKVVEETTYEALRSDSYADAVTMYGSHISVDKASAPGAKAYYRSRESDDVFYDGSRICYMRVPLKKGKKVKATFHLTYKKPEHFCNIFLVSPYYTLSSTTVIKVPASIASRMRVTPFNLTDDISFRSETLADGSVKYIAETHGRRRFPTDSGAPSFALSAPQLIVTGQFPDVDALYGYLRKYVGNEDYSDPALKELASSIATGCAERMHVIDSVTSWVRSNIRYLAVEHGEYAFKPEEAADVLRKRAGDCKGSANLIKALLRLNGFDARLVWLGTRRETSHDWDAVPALSSGNHVIAACMLPDTILYLDGTATWARTGYIPPSIRGSRTLIEDGDTYILSRVPDPGCEEDAERLTADFTIEGGDLRGNVTLTLSGVRRIEFLAAIADSEPRDRERLSEWMLSYPKKNSKVTGVKATRCDSLVTLTAEIAEKNSVSDIGDKIYVDLKPLRETMIAATDTAGRRAGLAIPYGYRSSYAYSIRIPDGYRIESLPDAVDIDDEWHSASISYATDGDRILCRCGVATRSLTAATEEIAERNKGIRALKKSSDSHIVLARISQE